jgi:hypothetical protein
MAEQKAQVEGEGSYSGAREYNERTKQFIEKKGQSIDELAEDAAEPLRGDDKLTDAEKEGLRKARH